MDQALEVFFSWQTLLLCFLSYGITFGLRNFIEGVWPQVTQGRVWPKAILPFIPMVVGTLLAFIPGFPWPSFLGSSGGSHAAYGFVCGMFSASVYARFKDFTKALPGSQPTPGKSDPPPSL